MPTTKEIQLRKHKAVATGLFLLMVAIYTVMVYLGRHHPASWVGYVHAFSEAAMVGALADWFAVTALFRYPLGLKIPHTNLIENKKNDIGENLGAFVKDNFLTEKNIRPYIERLDVAAWASKWLIQPANQKILLEEINRLVRQIVNDLPEAEVTQFMAQKAAEVLDGLDYRKMAVSGLQYALDNGEHIKLLDILLPKIRSYAEKSQDLVRERINAQSPVIGFLAGKKISREFTQGVVRFLEEIETDKNHWVRAKVTEALEKLRSDMATSSAWQERIDTWKKVFIATDKLLPYVQDAWHSLQANLLTALDDKDSMWSSYLKKNIQGFADKLHTDPELQTGINNWVRKFAYKTILRNRGQVETLISSTVADWKGDELSKKLELEVGKDLQFIRLNGTLVGGLVGLVIYTVTELLLH